MSDANLPAVQPARAITKRPKKEKKNDTKNERFRRLANERASKAVDAIHRIGNLGSPNYDYTDDEVQRVEKALIDAVRGAMQKLRARTAKKTGSLNLF